MHLTISKKAMHRNLVCLAAIAACSGGCLPKSELPRGAEAYTIIPSQEPAIADRQATISPFDTVTVTVFKEPDLSVSDRVVDGTGKLALPLLGSVSAVGKTPESLGRELEAQLAEYLVSPHVTVAVSSMSQKIAVEGHVNQPGLYDIRGPSSLIEAMALARSPTDIADLDQVFVYRRSGDQMLGARFDLNRIRVGIDPDPVILAGDRIVVGVDAADDAWRTYFASPIDSVFRVLADCSVRSNSC